MLSSYIKQKYIISFLKYRKRERIGLGNKIISGIIKLVSTMLINSLIKASFCLPQDRKFYVIKKGI
jgi:hypothetical protein